MVEMVLGDDLSHLCLSNPAVLTAVVTHMDKAHMVSVVLETGQISSSPPGFGKFTFSGLTGRSPKETAQRLASAYAVLVKSQLIQEPTKLCALLRGSGLIVLQQGRTTSTPPVRSARQRAAAAEAEATAEAAQTAAATAAAAAEKRKKAALVKAAAADPAAVARAAAAAKRKKSPKGSGEDSEKNNSGKNSGAKSKVLTLLRGQFARAMDGNVSRVAADFRTFGWASTDSPVPSKMWVVDGKGPSGMVRMTPNSGGCVYAARMVDAAAETDDEIEASRANDVDGAPGDDGDMLLVGGGGGDGDGGAKMSDIEKIGASLNDDPDVVAMRRRIA